MNASPIELASHRIGWTLILAGMVLGSLLGLWSFDGPLVAPRGFGLPDELPRRLVRLAHVALIALPIINAHLLTSVRIACIDDRRRDRCRISFLGGMILMPLFLIVAAFVPVAKYALVLPVALLILPVSALVSAPSPERSR